MDKRKAVIQAILAGNNTAGDIAKAAGCSKGFVLKRCIELENAKKITVTTVRVQPRNNRAYFFTPTDRLTAPDEPRSWGIKNGIRF